MVAVPPRSNLARSCADLFRAVAIGACIVMLPATAQAQGLKFFKNYFHTGGHFAAGVALKGLGIGGVATGNITIAAKSQTEDGVPADAEVLAAFLYWQTVTTASGNAAAGAQFRGESLSAIAKNLNPAGNPPCWSSGGATGGGSGSHQVKSYRADVLPFLPKVTSGPGLEKRTAIGTHQVVLPDSGNGNQLPSTAGASLLIIYRLGGANLASTVIYDGGFTLNHTTPVLNQPLLGWYEAVTPSLPSLPASLTQIVGNGQANFSESVTMTAGNATIFSSTNPFDGPNWDTYRETSLALPDGTQSASVTVQRAGSSGSFDCLTFSAMILSTAVEDDDSDGIVDRLETGELIDDPNTGEKLPNLFAMGARKGIKDIFIEFGMMRSTPGYNKGQTIAAGHTHLPDRAALDMVAKVFRFAPERINVHFDLGGAYAASMTATKWEACPTANVTNSPSTTWTTDCAFIPAKIPGTNTDLADGGEFIEETPCVLGGSQTSCLFSAYPGPLPCTNQTGATVPCLFPDYPGTVGWKSGYRAYRDEPLNFRKTTGSGANTMDAGPDERACFLAETDLNPNGTLNTSPNSTCKRRFARTRHDLFHYVLWAHAFGLPSTSSASKPRNVSGIGDVFGSDLMITLGLWDFATGTAFMQASTFLHELGHNLGLRHGGVLGEPNCKPNYQSVMNYLFQVRGLINAQGIAEIGYSNQELKLLNEATLSEAAGLTTDTGNLPMQWRTRWYTLYDDSFIDENLEITPVSKRCNGSPTETDPLMARVDGQNITGAIDWNANGATDSTIAGQDLNFSGLPFSSLTKGSNDWSNISLRDLGTRRNVGGWSADSGFWDTGFWDTGASSPFGFWDTGFWDTGFWDTGFWDTGFWDSGFWDTGAENDPDALLGELDLDTAGAVGNAPGQVTAARSGNNDVLVTWTPPSVGAADVDFYEVYRVAIATETSPITQADFAARVFLGSVDAPTIPTPTLQKLDTTTKNNVWYVYLVLAELTTLDADGDPVRTGVAFTAPFRR